MKNFIESEHPRDSDGKFTVKEYSKMSTNELKTIAQREYNEQTPKKTKPAPKSKEEFFGVEYKNVKGKEAIDKLLKEKQGHVKEAFYRKEVGFIDLVWGDDSGGILHVIKRRDQMKMIGKGNITGLEMAKKIPDIIGNGAFVIDEHDRLSFQFEGYKVGIKPTYFEEKLNWVVSAMEIIK